MSKKAEILLIEPPQHMNGPKQGEVFKYKGFECTNCNGHGGFSHAGWAAKFKKNITDPDWEECNICKGTGSLDANVVVGWVASENTGEIK